VADGASSTIPEAAAPVTVSADAKTDSTTADNAPAESARDSGKTSGTVTPVPLAKLMDDDKDFWRLLDKHRQELMS